MTLSRLVGEQLPCLLSSSWRVRALTRFVLKCLEPKSICQKLMICYHKMDSEVELSKLTCRLRAGCCHMSTCTFTSLQGHGNLVYSESVTFCSLLSSCGMSFEGSPLWSLLSHAYLAIIPELPFSIIPLFLLSICRIDFPPYLCCVSSWATKSASHPEGHWSDTLPARSSTLLCVRSVLTLS